MDEAGGLWKKIKATIAEHGGRLVGAGLGLATAVLLLTLGFWRTLLILLCVGLGWYFGGVRDYKAWTLKLVERISRRNAGEWKDMQLGQRNSKGEKPRKLK